MVRVVHVDYRELASSEMADGWVYDDPSPPPRRRLLLEQESALNDSSLYYPLPEPFLYGKPIKRLPQ